MLQNLTIGADSAEPKPRKRPWWGLNLVSMMAEVAGSFKIVVSLVAESKRLLQDYGLAGSFKTVISYG